MTNISCYNLLGVKVSVTNLDKTALAIEEWVSKRVKAYICIAPVATIVDCQKDNKYKEIVNNSNLTTPDGMPLVWLGKLKGNKEIERTYGPDLLLRICGDIKFEEFKHFFYGATQKTNQLLVEKLTQRFPKIKIVGTYAPPMRGVGEIESNEIIEMINNSGADILWVGLGSPKQDYWMSQHREVIHVPVMVGVGAAIDFMAGVKSQAPKWMRQLGFEWLYRLCCEPRRLWKRYLIGNSIFVFLVIREMLREAFQPRGLNV